MNIKDTNPKDSVGISKVPMSVVPSQVMMEVALAMYEGARKYGRSNYRVAGVRASVYYDACFRHLIAWWEGEDIDPDSGISHITKAIAGLSVLRDSMLNENWKDDRPPKIKNTKFIYEFNDKIKEIMKKYPDAIPAYTEIGVNKMKCKICGRLISDCENEEMCDKCQDRMEDTEIEE